MGHVCVGGGGRVRYRRYDTDDNRYIVLVFLLNENKQSLMRQNSIEIKLILHFSY